MINLTRIHRLVIYFFTTVYLAGCANTTQQADQWGTVETDTAIYQNPVYRELDKQPENFSAYENSDSLLKRTSDVAYLNEHELELQDYRFAKYNNCRAYFLKPDTLSINIGWGDLFGGRGFMIYLKDKKFYAKPYVATDVFDIRDIGPAYKVVYQKLILNRTNFAVGDSVYGYIDFKSVETDAASNTLAHYGKGYFRTKVKKWME